jgi:phage terminase Nu1 subunit (DNA packaging protein)
MCGETAMTEATTFDRPRPKRGNGRRDKALGPVLVSGNRLAVHFECVRQHIDQLAAQGVIERRAVDGLFDVDQSRLRYLTHLRSAHRRSPRTAADAEHVKVKTEILQLKLAENRRDLVRQSDVDALIDDLGGVVLTALHSMPARCARRGLGVRRCIEQVEFDVRTEIARIAQQKADEAGEPPL